MTTENKTTENKGFENSGENAEFRRITIYDDIDRADLFGSMDSHLDLISQGAGVEIFQRDNELLIRGENVELAAGIIEELIGKLFRLVYPGYYPDYTYRIYNPEKNLSALLEDVAYHLNRQIAVALRGSGDL